MKHNFGTAVRRKTAGILRAVRKLALQFDVPVLPVLTTKLATYFTRFKKKSPVALPIYRGV